MVVKSYTDLPQSQRLSKILHPVTADMWYRDGCGLMIPELGIIPRSHTNTEFPCWSLAALIKVLPRSVEYKGDTYYLGLLKDYVEYANNKISLTGIFLHTTGNDNLVDACVEIIEKLHEQKLL